MVETGERRGEGREREKTGGVEGGERRGMVERGKGIKRREEGQL